MGNAFKIRVLLDYEQDVFRDFLVPKNTNFEVFHQSILTHFGFPNNQMASFYLSNDQWDKGEEIPLFDVNEDFGPDSLPVMSNVNLEEKLTKKGQKMVYVYDFLLMWCFYVDVLDIVDSPAKMPELLNSFGKPPKPSSKKGDLNFSAETAAGESEFSDIDFNDDENGDDDENDDPFHSEEFDDDYR